jgi:FO synthase subunit 2
VSLGALFDGVAGPVRAVLERSLEGQPPDEDEALLIGQAGGAALHALVLTADAVRRRQVGEVVTYVVNRNVNFTNVCVKSCGFCAFSRAHRSEEAYFLGADEIVRRAEEAVALGASELCLQAGLAPGLDGRYYVELVRTLKRALPGLHLHAFSPEEVKYGALRARLSIAEYLAALKEAGLDTLPGTSAEILADEVRARIAPSRISTAEWIEVVTTAHRLGLPTSATLMFGHVESLRDQVRHLRLLGRIQAETGGFTELVPLSFVHGEAPMYQEGAVAGLRAGPSGVEVLRLFALARLLLGHLIPNLQASWVKEGLRTAQLLLQAGANDLGGTLMNESISTTAGAPHGQMQRPATLRATIRALGRVPAERTTRYQLRRRFDEEPAEPDPLDRLDDPARLGSYAALAHDPRFRFRLRARP